MICETEKFGSSSMGHIISIVSINWFVIMGKAWKNDKFCMILNWWYESEGLSCFFPGAWHWLDDG